MSTSLKLLSIHKLTITKPRTLVLDLFLNNKRALSNTEIEQKLRKSVNRVSIYRILDTFVDYGIIHKVIHDGTTMLYALSQTDDASNMPFKHAHFKCNLCERTYCLNVLSLQIPKSIKGFKINHSDVLLSGICNSCNK